MAKTCTVCRDERRPLIDKALVSGEPVRDVALRFVPLSAAALHRHKAHIGPRLVKAKEAREVAQATDLLNDLRQLRQKAATILLKAEAAGDLRTALLGVREARACLELLAEMEHELDRRPVVNLLAAPEWVALRGRIVATLAEYPEARLALAEALGGD